MKDERQHIPSDEHAASFYQVSEEILQSFLVESNELLEQLGIDLLQMEKENSDSDLLNRIFRSGHTLKGTSSFLGFSTLTGLAHKVEDLLNRVRKGELLATPEMMDILFNAYDRMKELLRKIQRQRNDSMDVDDILRLLDGAAHGNGSVVGVKKNTEQDREGNRDSSAEVGTTLVENTLRVDVERLNELMNLVGELVLDRNRLFQLTHRIGEEREKVQDLKDIVETSAHIDRITTELQMAVMKTRMIPIGKVFTKLPRLVRDVARETGKEIDLRLEWEETELDKSVIEQLSDPLVHLIRNAGDHGIELPDEREKAGKSRKGNLTVRARHEGSYIVLSVADDGRGMDPETLKRVAVQKGVISEVQANELSDQDAFNLIFVAGFSTAEHVTNVSGRGVGMDVVRSNIAKLKGIIEIQSQKGIGTLFTVKLPSTLAIIESLLVQGGGEVYAVPLSSVLEVVRTTPGAIHLVNGTEVLRLRDAVIPLSRLNRIFDLGETNTQEHFLYIVIVGWAERRIGIVVDSLLGQKEIVVKPLGDFLSSVPAIAGSTILGDGRTILILDVGQYIQLCDRSLQRNLFTVS